MRSFDFVVARRNDVAKHAWRLYLLLSSAEQPSVPHHGFYGTNLYGNETIKFGRLKNIEINVGGRDHRVKQIHINTATHKSRSAWNIRFAILYLFGKWIAIVECRRKEGGRGGGAIELDQSCVIDKLFDPNSRAQHRRCTRATPAESATSALLINLLNVFDISSSTSPFAAAQEIHWDAGMVYAADWIQLQFQNRKSAVWQRTKKQ